MKLREILPQVYLVTTRRTSDLGRIFVRFQESYESPCGKFRGKRFNLKVFKKWYRKRYGGTFSYYNDWGGFNVPGPAVSRFVRAPLKYRKGQFIRTRRSKSYDLSKREQWLINELKKQPNFSFGKPFCVIGSTGNNKGTLAHEMAHSMYFLNPVYRRLVQQTLKDFRRTKKQKEAFKKFSAFLLKNMYYKGVIEDEIHAYLVDDQGWLTAEKVWCPEFEPCRIILRNYFTMAVEMAKEAQNVVLR